MAYANVPRDTNKSPIAAKRIEVGMTQKQLAEKLHTSQAYVSSIEIGDVVPTVKRLKEIADIFGCKWSELA